MYFVTVLMINNVATLKLLLARLERVFSTSSIVLPVSCYLDDSTLLDMPTQHFEVGGTHDLYLARDICASHPSTNNNGLSLN